MLSDPVQIGDELLELAHSKSNWRHVCPIFAGRRAQSSIEYRFIIDIPIWINSLLYSPSATSNLPFAALLLVMFYSPLLLRHSVHNHLLRIHHHPFQPFKSTATIHRLGPARSSSTNQPHSLLRIYHRPPPPPSSYLPSLHPRPFPGSYHLQPPRPFFFSAVSRPDHPPKPWSKSSKILLGLTFSFLLATTLYEFNPTFRYQIVGLLRCSRVGLAVLGAIWDYTLLFEKVWDDDPIGRAQRHLDYETTHLTAARRILQVLKINGGIYVKLGQHLSAVQLIPSAWRSTMKPLQDQCIPSSLESIDQLFLDDLGLRIHDLFQSFDPIPIGVASLAQVHRAVDRQTGRQVAVKILHPTLEDYFRIDIRTVLLMLRFVKWVFPEFEFTWLAEEMQENLPKEMDLRIEANNALECSQRFSSLKLTSLKIPDVLLAKKRVLVMEYVTGGRFDDLEYLAKHNIDRNRASQELSKIFSQMIYLNGYFHGDPHAGNLLIRPASKSSRSPYNFEIVLLDHGLYFHLSDELRVNYARLWISLLDSSPRSIEDRKRYAKLVGNIDESDYDVFEVAITGRVGLKGNGSLMGLSTSLSTEEQKLIQKALITQENVFADILKILRNAPRRLLMIFKVNDLTRSLDLALKTTHSQIRIWLIVARFCSLAIWLDELNRLKEHLTGRSSSIRLPGHGTKSIDRLIDSIKIYLGFFYSWYQYQKWYNGLRFLEIGMDLYASWNKSYMFLTSLLSSPSLSSSASSASDLELNRSPPPLSVRFETAKRRAAGL